MSDAMYEASKLSLLSLPCESEAKVNAHTTAEMCNKNQTSQSLRSLSHAQMISLGEICLLPYARSSARDRKDHPVNIFGST